MFRKAVLVIHGFGGGTWENEYLVNYLKFNTNYDVYDFTLPGHNLDIINKVKYKDWVNASDDMVKKIIKKYGSLYVIGHSMGGVIASFLASKHKQIKKLILLSPAFEYINLNQNKEDIKEIIKSKDYKSKYEEHIYSEAFTKIFKIPLPTILEFTKLVKHYKDDIKDVTCNTLIMHGTLDEIVPISSSDYAYNNIGSKVKHKTNIIDAKHRLLLGNKKEKISEYIKIYLRGGLEWEFKKKLEI